MTVDVVKTRDVKHIYLEHLKQYPNEACKPKIEGSKATFSLDLQNIYQCLVTKVVDKGTGRRVYYHRIIMEHFHHPKSVFLVKCDTGVMHSENSTSYDSEVQQLSLVKRSAQFPVDFEEPDYEIEITSEVTGRAPIPELSVGVRQSGILIDDELTVKPGTPLNMEILLDNASRDIYGVMVSNMDVSDTRSQQESLIVNGCTVDPYLFENFLTEDGDLLRANFKAFKFPESNFVEFRGTVNVCLDKCSGVECANGQIGFGRRRRSSSSGPNRVYEVSMSTLVKVADDPLNPEPVRFEKATLREVYHADEVAVAALSEEFGAYKYIDFNAAATTSLSIAMAVIVAVARFAF